MSWGELSWGELSWGELSWGELSWGEWSGNQNGGWNNCQGTFNGVLTFSHSPLALVTVPTAPFVLVTIDPQTFYISKTIDPHWAIQYRSIVTPKVWATPCHQKPVLTELWFYRKAVYVLRVVYLNGRSQGPDIHG
jgi:hypothetical protein